jgi:hypothetical protein
MVGSKGEQPIMHHIVCNDLSSGWFYMSELDGIFRLDGVMTVTETK